MNRDGGSLPTDNYEQPNTEQQPYDPSWETEPLETPQALSFSLDEYGLPPDHSCKHCQHIIIRAHDFIHPKTTLEIQVAKNRTDVAHRSADGCPFYVFLNWYIWQPEAYHPRTTCSVWFAFNCKNDFVVGLRCKFRDSDGILSMVGDTLDVVTPPSDPASQHIPSRPRDLSISSPSYFKLANDRLQACHNGRHGKHERCFSTSNHSLPARLLKVNILTSTVSLVTTKSLLNTQSLNYAALSYCWGGPQAMETRQDNLQNRINTGIAVDCLPKTLQDAIKVTNEVGLEFLWVDSLCIVQDDQADKETEIPKMADIYGGSYVTISAASARSCEEGFLHDRRPSGGRRYIAVLPFLCSDGSKGKVYIHPVERNDNRVSNPISERAWTFQEYLLSPRMLIYGTVTLNWVCRTEEGLNGAPRITYQPITETLTHDLFSQKTDPHFREEVWKTLVREFTTRSLSVPSDRSAAIFGIAKQCSKLDGQTYLAGVWKERIASGLLWQRPSDTSYSTTLEISPRRSPSWSWTSVDGKISWSYTGAHRRYSLKLISHEPVSLEEQLLLDNFPLLVEGKIRSAYFHTTRPSVLFFQTDQESHLDNKPIVEGSLATTARAILDNALTEEGMIHVLCLEVLSYDGPIMDNTNSMNYLLPAGIILEKRNNGLARIGFFDFDRGEGVGTDIRFTVPYDKADNERSKAWKLERADMRREVFANCSRQQITLI